MGHNIGQDQVKLNMGQDVTVDTMTGPSKIEYSKGYCQLLRKYNI